MLNRKYKNKNFKTSTNPMDSLVAICDNILTPWNPPKYVNEYKFASQVAPDRDTYATSNTSP